MDFLPGEGMDLEDHVGPRHSLDHLRGPLEEIPRVFLSDGPIFFRVNYKLDNWLIVNDSKS